MKALLLRQQGGLDNLSFGELPKPHPTFGQVLVRMRAAALNHLDLFVVQGIPGIQIPFPHVPGADGAGEVAAVGDGVQRFKIGDRVMLNACVWCGQCEFCLAGEHSLCIRLQLIGEHLPGTMGEFFIAPEDNLEAIPNQIDFQQAAAFSLVHQTAWRMLMSRGKLQAGEDVFIHGIGGGVSLAALGIAKLAGARVFVSSSSSEKLKRAAQLGADFGFDYGEQDVVRKVMEATGRRGVDLVVDNVGAATWLQSLRLVRKGGRIVTCGATTGPNPKTDIRLIFWKQIRILGSTMSSASEYRKLVGLMGQGKLSPVIDRTYRLDEAPQAFKRLSNGHQFGKILIQSD